MARLLSVEGESREERGRESTQMRQGQARTRHGGAAAASRGRRLQRKVSDRCSRRDDMRGRGGGVTTITCPRQVGRCDSAVCVRVGLASLAGRAGAGGREGRDTWGSHGARGCYLRGRPKADAAVARCACVGDGAGDAGAGGGGRGCDRRGQRQRMHLQRRVGAGGGEGEGGCKGGRRDQLQRETEEKRRSERSAGVSLLTSRMRRLN